MSFHLRNSRLRMTLTPAEWRAGLSMDRSDMSLLRPGQP